MNAMVVRNEPSGVRKTAFGRTSLFLNNSQDATNVRCVRRSSSAMTRVHGATYHNLNDSERAVKGAICCWHCCEEITEGNSFKIPKNYNSHEGVYHVYGHFDCLSCCKAFILEQSRFDCAHQMNLFTQMAQEVYGQHEPIVAAPPRISLQRFGGPMRIDEFRQCPRVVRILEPPFVSYCMLAEEHPTAQTAVDASATEVAAIPMVDDDAFSEPAPCALYNDFVEARRATPDCADVSDAPLRKRRAAKTVPTRTSSLARFCKKTASGDQC